MRKRLNKIVSTLVAGVLCVSFVPLTAIASDEDIALTSDPVIVETVEGGEPAASETVENPEVPEVVKPTVGEEEPTVEGVVEPEINLAAELDDTEEGIDPQSENVAEFDLLKEAIENGSVSSIDITESMVATKEIHISGDVTIAAAQDVTISRDSQTHSIFVVESTGSLTLKGVKLIGDSKVESRSGISFSAVSPIISSGNLKMVKGSQISGFVGVRGGGATIESGSFELSDSVIDGNYVDSTDKERDAKGGGVYIIKGDVVFGSGASVQNNVVFGRNDRWSGQNYGGGVCIDQGSLRLLDGSQIKGNSVGNSSRGDCPRDAEGGGLFIGPDAKFSLQGGVIENNISYKRGGGIAFSADSLNRGTLISNINLERGKITGNTADTGGGMYLPAVSYLQITKAAIVNNEANGGWLGTGGGLWSCGVGDLTSYSSSGCLIAENDGYKYGNDFVAEPFGLPDLTTRLHDGSRVNWASDTHGNSSAWESSSIKTIEDIDEYVINWIQEWESSGVPYAYWGDLALKTQPQGSKGDPYYTVLISGNKALSYGGGIGYNGHLTMGEDNDKELVIQKEWKTLDGAELTENLPEFIEVEVFNGEKKIDQVSLSAENDWTVKLIDLPGDGEYTVKEVELKNYAAEYVMADKPTSDEDPIPGYVITITNTLLPTEGELTITKTFNGSVNTMVDPDGNIVGSATAVFHVEGYMQASTDEFESASSENEEAVEGEESSAGEEGSEGEAQKETIIDEDGTVWVKFYDNFVGINISDKNNSVTLTNLPVGAKFVVTEMLYDQSGFMVNGDAVRTKVLEKAATPVIAFDYENTIDNEEHPNQGVVNRYSFTTESKSKSVDPRWAA